MVSVHRTRRDRVSVAFLVPPPPHHSTPSVCLNKGPTRWLVGISTRRWDFIVDPMMATMLSYARLIVHVAFRHDQELGSLLDDQMPFDLLTIMRGRTSWPCKSLLS